ncbi:uncharacterized protein TM35_000841110, partial [Trypanosoma theileri]
RYEELVEQAREKVKETSRLKEECEKAGEAARQAANEAQVFAAAILSSLDQIAADPEKVEETKSEGRKFIDNTTQAAEKAKKVAAETTASAKETEDKVSAGLLPGPEGEAAWEVAGHAQSAVR